MAFVTWTPALRLGDDIIDGQHRRLIDTLNRLHEAMTQGKGYSVIMQILDELVLYAKSHFVMEEHLFRRYDYPFAEEHMREHREFLKQVLRYRDQCEENQSVVSLETLVFLKDWFDQHVRGADAKYIAYLRKHQHVIAE